MNANTITNIYCRNCPKTKFEVCNSILTDCQRHQYKIYEGDYQVSSNVNN